jgi:hypothetical protein
MKARKIEDTEDRGDPDVEREFHRLLHPVVNS